MSEHKGKKHKPAANHPWRNAVRAEIAKWAKETAEQSEVNDWKVGGGRNAWNGPK